MVNYPLIQTKFEISNFIFIQILMTLVEGHSNKKSHVFEFFGGNISEQILKLI